MAARAVVATGTPERLCWRHRDDLSIVRTCKVERGNGGRVAFQVTCFVADDSKQRTSADTQRCQQADLTAAGLANRGLENQANLANVGRCMLFGAKHMAKKITACLHPAMATRTVFWHETCCCLQLTTRTSRSLDHCPIWCHVGAFDRQQSTASCKITKQQRVNRGSSGYCVPKMIAQNPAALRALFPKT